MADIEIRKMITPFKKGNSLSYVFPVLIGTVVLVFVLYGIECYAKFRSENEWQFPLDYVGFFKPIEKEKEVVVVNTEVVKTKSTWAGKASWYGASSEACVGCDKNFIMANGKKLDDRIRTVAFNELPLGSMVVVKNVDSGLEEVVEVTDTGGFDGLGRIADLSLALKNSLKCSDLCNVMIEEY